MARSLPRCKTPFRSVGVVSAAAFPGAATVACLSVKVAAGFSGTNGVVLSAGIMESSGRAGVLSGVPAAALAAGTSAVTEAFAEASPGANISGATGLDSTPSRRADASGSSHDGTPFDSPRATGHTGPGGDKAGSGT